MPKLLNYYGFQPRIRYKLDDLVVLEGRQLFDHATRQRLENYADEILGVEYQRSEKKRLERQDLTLTSADPSTFQEM